MFSYYDTVKILVNVCQPSILFRWVTHKISSFYLEVDRRLKYTEKRVFLYDKMYSMVNAAVSFQALMKRTSRWWQV